MPVKGLNHINIVARDMAQTVTFYEQVLGMKATPIPNMPAGYDGRWIHDEPGRAVIHVQAYNPERHGALPPEGTKTGAIDHVALTCADMPAMLRRCEQLGIEYRVNDGKFAGLKQVFICDPDNVKLELNFPEG